MYQQIRHKLFQNVDKNIYCCITHPDNNLFMMYTYLISAIKNIDSRGIMNQIAIENLIYALETPVVSIEVINILIFLPFIEKNYSISRYRNCSYFKHLFLIENKYNFIHLIE